MTRVIHPLALALVALGCAPGTITDLDRPAIGVSVREPGGFCSAVYAVDGAGAVWASGGCGDDVGDLTRRERTVGDAERTELDAMMDEVLALRDEPDCAVVSPSDRRLRFTRATDGATEEVTVCLPGEPVAARLVERFESLAVVAAADAGAEDAGVGDAG